MRKHCLFILICFACLQSFSQRYPQGLGTFRTSGSVSLLPVILPSGEVQYRISLTPAIGYFFSDEALMGMAMSYNATVGADSYEGQFRVSPQSKYYYSFDKQTFITANFNYNFELNTETVEGERIVVDNSGIAFGPGASYFFSRKIGIEGVLLYTYYFFPDVAHQNKFSFSMGFNLNIPSKKHRSKPGGKLDNF